MALLSPLIYVPILTYAFGPQNYDYRSMAAIKLGNDEDIAAAANVDLELIPGAAGMTRDQAAEEQKHLKKASVIAKSMTVFLTLALLILWPMPMYGTGYVFSKKFFTGWVSVGILWLFCSSFAVGVFPVWEGRKSMANTFKGIWWDLRGKQGRRVRGSVFQPRGSVVEGKEVPPSPTDAGDKGGKEGTTITEKGSP